MNLTLTAEIAASPAGGTPGPVTESEPNEAIIQEGIRGYLGATAFPTEEIAASLSPRSFLMVADAYLFNVYGQETEPVDETRAAERAYFNDLFSMPAGDTASPEEAEFMAQRMLKLLVGATATGREAGLTDGALQRFIKLRGGYTPQIEAEITSAINEAQTAEIRLQDKNRAQLRAMEISGVYMYSDEFKGVEAVGFAAARRARNLRNIVEYALPKLRPAPPRVDEHPVVRRPRIRVMLPAQA